MSANNTTVVVPSRAEDLLVLYVWFLTSFVFTIVASLILIFLISVILAVKKFRGGAGYLLLHLLVVNLIISGFAQPLMLIERFMASKHTPVDINCKAAMLIRFVAICVECWAELSLAVNRLIAISFPHHYRWWTQKPVMLFMILCSWLICAALLVPSIYNYGLILGKFPPLNVCTALPVRGITIPVFELGMYLPLGLVCFIYAIVGVSLITRRTNLEDQQMRRRVKLAGILFASYIFNLVCYMPMPIMGSYFGKVLAGSPTAALWLVTTQVVGYGANPIFFFSLNDEYRKSARMLVQGRRVAALNTLDFASNTKSGNRESTNASRPARQPAYVD